MVRRWWHNWVAELKMLRSNNLETTEEIQGCSENMQRAGGTQRRMPRRGWDGGKWPTVVSPKGSSPDKKNKTSLIIKQIWYLLNVLLLAYVCIYLFNFIFRFFHMDWLWWVQTAKDCVTTDSSVVIQMCHKKRSWIFHIYICHYTWILLWLFKDSSFPP